MYNTNVNGYKNMMIPDFNLNCYRYYNPHNGLLATQKRKHTYIKQKFK